MNAKNIVPSQFTNGDGTVTIVGGVLLTLSITALIYQIVVANKTISKMEKEEESQQKKIAELEFNLKKVRGASYEKLPSA
jgi:hypothetical protein